MQKSVLIGAPRGVDIEHVERELAGLWEDSRELAGPGTEPMLMRACSMNLVAVSDEAVESEEEGEVLGDVSVAHPARILRLLAAVEGSVPEVSVSVSARCTIPVPGRGQVCSEEVVVRAARRESLFSTISSLLVPDVPTILLWRPSVDPHDQLLRSLAAVADRVLVDSALVPDPLRMLGRWHQLMFAPPADDGFWGMTLAGDLSWTRLSEWRSVLAAAVEAPDMRSLLSEGRMLELEYTGEALAQAVLYTGWFCSRMEWELAKVTWEEKTLVIEALPSDRSIRVTRIDRDGPGTLTRVVLADMGGRRVEIARTDDTGCVRVSRVHDTVRTEEFVRHAVSEGEAALLVRELEMLEHDIPYEAAMGWVGGLLEHLHR